MSVNFGPRTQLTAATLLETSRQEYDELFITQVLERANREIHGYLAAVVALERDGYADRL
ncbi:MAG: hypothetical protein M3P12_09035 [Gemmatimonadota bacterium]|nr:hypothetical protein [Gemmatimonadota bacterium]